MSVIRPDIRHSARKTRSGSTPNRQTLKDLNRYFCHLLGQLGEDDADDEPEDRRNTEDYNVDRVLQHAHLKKDLKHHAAVQSAREGYISRRAEILNNFLRTFHDG